MAGGCCGRPDGHFDVMRCGMRCGMVDVVVNVNELGETLIMLLLSNICDNPSLDPSLHHLSLHHPSLHHSSFHHSSFLLHSLLQTISWNAVCFIARTANESCATAIAAKHHADLEICVYTGERNEYKQALTEADFLVLFVMAMPARDAE